MNFQPPPTRTEKVAAVIMLACTITVVAAGLLAVVSITLDHILR